MSSLVEQSKAAIFELADLASGSPDPVSLIHVQAKLVRLHAELGQEMARRYQSKERNYLSRKIAHAKEYKSNRYDVAGKVRKASADADHDALLAIGEEFAAEIDSAAEYEGYRTLLKSMQNAIDFGRSLISFYKSSEGNA